MADVTGGVVSHQCRHCENIIFSPGQKIRVAYEDVERAWVAGCELFRSIAEKVSKANIRWPDKCSDLVMSWNNWYLDHHWEDGVTRKIYPRQDELESLPAFAMRDDLTAKRIKTKSLNPGPGSEESFEIYRSWIRSCEEGHERCRGVREKLSQQCPARLIHVGKADDKDIRVHSTEPNSRVQYAALSYCWGGNQEKSMTVRQNLDERHKGFPLAKLPQTIQDGIITTRKLGLDYLWVDAICIIQDDEADIQHELIIMDEIYSGAFITIIVARATKVYDGFLQPRNVEQGYGSVCRVRYRQTRKEGTEEIKSAFLSANLLDITYDDPIDSRGWTFQERCRSFRTLRFGSKQTVWECPEGHKVDGGRNYRFESSNDIPFTGTLKDSPDRFRPDNICLSTDRNWALEGWQKLVHEYSNRNLTQPTDKLPAFAAIAKAFGTLLQLDPECYLAGLWDFDICMQLRWRRPDDMPIGGWCRERHGPTWSWSSLKGPVTFGHQRLPRGVNTLKLVRNECRIQWKSPEFKYGEVQSARLVVNGFLRRATWMQGQLVGWHNTASDQIVLPLVAYWDSDEEAQEIWCLEINAFKQTSVGILLAKSTGDIYRRLGYFEFDHSEILPEPIKDALDWRGFPLNSNWFYDGGYQRICIE